MKPYLQVVACLPILFGGARVMAQSGVTSPTPSAVEVKVGNPCEHPIGDPRRAMQRAELLLIGTVVAERVESSLQVAEIDVEVVWKGGLHPGETVCLPLWPDDCPQPSARVGDRYLIWSACRVAEVQAVAKRSGAYCKAHSGPLDHQWNFLEFVNSSGPEISRSEVTARLHAWQAGRMTAQAMYDWLSYGSRPRDFSDWNGNTQSLTFEVLGGLGSWVYKAAQANPTEACRMRDVMLEPIFELLSKGRITTDDEILRWNNVAMEIYRKMNASTP